MNRSIVIITLAVFALTGSAVMAWAANNGPANIDIFGGKSGKTPFPHAQHQKRIQDCNVCHSVFPQEKDAIKKMKAQGTIKPKKVMNLQCIKCHKEEKRAGNPSGPLTCKTCHVKS
ncbi:putative cyctchrome c, class III family protein [Desulfosarcina variabilis str. Montpellier]|uniref:cytochrome c3 family protein n=1 Tax=Desulfosarcina variabilis TaxID=2300 RepID=UPI003AFAA9DC